VFRGGIKCCECTKELLIVASAQMVDVAYWECTGWVYFFSHASYSARQWSSLFPSDALSYWRVAKAKKVRGYE
jgi:hypothetical protein